MAKILQRESKITRKVVGPSLLMSQEIISTEKGLIGNLPNRLTNHIPKRVFLFTIHHSHHTGGFVKWAMGTHKIFLRVQDQF